MWWKERLHKMLSKRCGSWHFDLEDSTLKSFGFIQTYQVCFILILFPTNSWLNLLFFPVGKSNILMIMNFILGSSSLVFNLTTPIIATKNIFYSPYCGWFSVHGSEIRPQPPRMYQNWKTPLNSGIKYSNHNWLAGFLNHQSPSTTITSHAEAPWYSPIALRQHRHA